MKHKTTSTWWALVSSIASLFVCMALLVGTTFAWFTDSAASGTASVTGGNLEITLSVKKDGNGYVGVSEPYTLFEDVRWEPGHTEVAYLRVENTGKLALKYRFSVGITEETEGTNVAGDPFKLSNYLVFGIVSGSSEPTDEEISQAISNGRSLGASAVEAQLLPASDDQTSNYIALVVYMPDDINEAINYRSGTTPPKIKMEATLVATQAPTETDSFDQSYDANAVLPVMSTAELQAALTAGGSLSLGQDFSVVVDGTGNGLAPQMTVQRNTTINLESKTLGVEAAQDLAYTPVLMEVAEGATLTINGDGAITAEAGNNNSYGINVNGGSLIINGGQYYGAPTAIQVQKGSLVINNGFFDLAPTCKVAVPGYAKYVVNAIDSAFRDGTATIMIKGGTFVNFDPSDNPEGTGTSYVADGYKVINETQSNGDIWYTVVPE